MMTRKDFNAMAEMVSHANYLTTEQKEQLARDLADFCKSQNSNFDTQRFINACCK